MTTVALLPNAPDLSADDYCVFGLATCFLREDGEIRQVEVVEPIPSGALEAILKGIPTSYRLACAKAIGEVLGDTQPRLPLELTDKAEFGDNFTERTIAATRTYKSRIEAKAHIPLGTVRNDFNYSLQRKRVLNSVNVVSTEDNVKQHEYTHKVL